MIVASILLAFAVDAGWENRVEKTRLDATFEQLLVQWRVNRTELTGAINTNERIVGRMQTFLSASPATVLEMPLDSLVGIGVAMTASSFYGQEGGTVESFVASGDLALIHEPFLRGRLGTWSTLPRELDKEATSVRATDRPIRGVMAQHGVLAALLASTDGQNIPGAQDLNRALADMRGSQVAMDHVASRIATIRWYIGRLEAATRFFDLLNRSLQSR